MDELLQRHESETKQLRETSKEMLKSAKKSERSAIEARIIQTEFDLKARHRDEIEELEEKLGEVSTQSYQSLHEKISESIPYKSIDEIVQSKKAKNQRKKERKAEKKVERMNQIREMELNSGPTQRQVELESINNHLKPYNLAVKEIISDGHCLYRAIADQLHCDSETDFVTLRKLAADHIRNNSDSYLPFINSECSGSFDDYCRQVEDLSGAVWGGQIEIRALCESLHRPIYVFSSDSPILKMGLEESGDVIYLTYHRHYYALGAHYNSTQPLHTNI